MQPAVLRGKFIRNVDSAGSTTVAACYAEGSAADADELASFTNTTTTDSVPGTNYNARAYAYDDNGRQNRVVDPTGTITDKFFNAFGEAVSTYVGTDDSTTDGDDWTPGVNGSAANNMTLISASTYDNGGAGDGNRVSTTGDFLAGGTSNDFVSVLGRASGNSGYDFGETAAGTYYLVKVLSGTATTLATASTAAPSGEVTLQLVMSGSSLIGLANGTQVLSATDGSIASAGSAGIEIQTGPPAYRSGSDTTLVHALNFSAANLAASPTASANQTTTYTYNGNGSETSMTAVMPAGTPSQTTAWVYGVTPSGGSTINSNDVLSKVELPNASTGAASTAASDDVSYNVDALGETIGMTDQNGTTHSYGLDVLGRQTSDAVTVLGPGVDGAVRLRTIDYNTQGSVYQMTAYGSTLGGTVLNQVEDAYNGLSQLAGEYQSHSGAVNTSSTPQTQYAYSDPTSGSLMTSMTYPNGRILRASSPARSTTSSRECSRSARAARPRRTWPLSPRITRSC